MHSYTSREDISRDCTLAASPYTLIVMTLSQVNKCSVTITVIVEIDLCTFLNRGECHVITLAKNNSLSQTHIASYPPTWSLGLSNVTALCPPAKDLYV